MGKHGKMPKRRVHFDMPTGTRPHGGRKAPLMDADSDIAEQLEWYEEEEEKRNERE